MNTGWRKELNRLATSIQNVKEAEELFNELFTPAEYDEFAIRWQIVKMLIKGKPQRDVSKTLSISITTVSRGARELKYGKGSFNKFYQRLYKK